MTKESEQEIRRDGLAELAELEQLAADMDVNGKFRARRLRRFIDFLIKDREAHGRKAWEEALTEAALRALAVHEWRGYDDVDWAKSEQREGEK